MKYLLFVLVFASAVCASASTTAITASNITDVSGNRIASARLCFAAVDEDGDAIGYRSGTAQVGVAKKCGIVSNGVLQSGFTVLDSGTTVPTNVRYHITLTTAGSSATTLRDFGTTTITGSSWTLDTFDASTVALPSIYTASSTSGDLAVNGNLSASGLTSLASVTVTGPLSVSGLATLASATVSGAFGVTGAATLGNTAVSGTLSTSGLATLASAMVSGAFGVTGTSTLGNTIVGGTLSTSGLATLASATVSGAFGVSGLSTLSNTTVSGTLSTSGLATLASATVSGSFGVTGASTLSNTAIGGTLSTSGLATLASATVSGAFGVSGLSTLGNTTVGGTLSTSGLATLASAAVSGSFGVTGLSTLSNTTVGGTLSTSGLATLASATVSGAFGVTGATTLSGTLATGPITESGSSGNTLTFISTAGSLNALAVVDPSLVVGSYAVGMEVGTAVNSTYNSALLGFVNLGGTGSTSNAVILGIYGGPDTYIFGTGDMSIGSMADCGGRLCVSGAEYLSGGYFDITPSNGGGGYNEGIRIHPASNGYSTIQLGAIAGASGTGTGQWSIDAEPSGQSYIFGIWYDGTANAGISVTTGGALTATGAVSGTTWTATSDKREKHNIKTLDPEFALQEVSEIRAVTFDWNSSDDHQRQTGWIAQEVEAGGLRSSVNVRPGTVHHRDGTTADVSDFRTLKQNEMTAVLWSAVQELNRKVDGLGPAPKHHRIGRKLSWLGL